MIKQLKLLTIVVFLVGLMGDYSLARQKVYIYAWKLQADVASILLVNKQIENSKDYILYWSSPWPISKREKLRIINHLKNAYLVEECSIHFNKGFVIVPVDRKLLKNGTVKTGLVNVIGGSKKQVGKLSKKN